MALRAAPRDSAKQQAVLWQGEMVEVRGERMDYLQVYDYGRERGGFVRANQVRRLTLAAEEAPELLAIIRFVRDTPGSEALGIGLVAAFIQAAPAEVINGDAGSEALDALGTLADRLARRASGGANPNKGRSRAVRASRRGGALRRQVRQLRARRAHAPLLRGRCVPPRIDDALDGGTTRPRGAGPDARRVRQPNLRVTERNQADEWRAEVLDRVDAAALPGYLKNRVLMRRASVWSAIAYQHTRKNLPSDAAASRALTELGGINKAELTDDDLAVYADAAMRASASRWAVLPVAVAAKVRATSIVTEAGEAGQTCVALVDAKRDIKNPLVRRCTYGIVWANSATLNREGNALALAVQQTDTWRELWIFRKSSDGWTIGVLPPATTTPDVGYAEFAGWVPGGKEMLVAREAKGDGKYKRNFELLRLDTLTPMRQAGDPTLLGAFQRWQDPAWKRQTLSLR